MITLLEKLLHKYNDLKWEKFVLEEHIEAVDRLKEDLIIDGSTVPNDPDRVVMEGYEDLVIALDEVQKQASKVIYGRIKKNTEKLVASMEHDYLKDICDKGNDFLKKMVEDVTKNLEK